jgi:hypothetical protein
MTKEMMMMMTHGLMSIGIAGRLIVFTSRFLSNGTCIEQNAKFFAHVVNSLKKCS